MAVLAALGLDHADDALAAVDVADPQTHHFTGPQPAAIGQREQHPNLQVLGHEQEAFGLVPAHHQGDLLRLADMVDLFGKIQPPQRHAEEKPGPVMSSIMRWRNGLIVFVVMAGLLSELRSMKPQ
jgi:hypothetical protein